MIAEQPFLKIDGFEKTTESLDQLYAAINALGPENFREPLAPEQFDPRQDYKIEIKYNPADLSDWNSSESPINTRLALDQLADRLTNIDKIAEGDSSVEVIDSGTDGRVIFTLQGAEVGRFDDTDGHFGVGTGSTVDCRIHAKDSVNCCIKVQTTGTAFPAEFQARADTALGIITVHGSTHSGTIAGISKNNMVLLESSAGDSFLVGTEAVDTANIYFTPKRVESARIEAAGDWLWAISKKIQFRDANKYISSPFTDRLDIVNRDTEIRIFDNGSATSTVEIAIDGTTALHVRDGKIGIGTTNPASNFDLTINKVKTNTDNTTYAYLGKTSEAVNYAALQLNMIGGASQAVRSWEFQTIEQGIANAGNIVLQTFGGNVGIGQASPSERLDIKGGDAILETSGQFKFRDTNKHLSSPFTNRLDLVNRDTEIRIFDDGSATSQVIILIDGAADYTFEATRMLVNSSNQVQFRDTNKFINSDATNRIRMVNRNTEITIFDDNSATSQIAFVLDGVEDYIFQPTLARFNTSNQLQFRNSDKHINSPFTDRLDIVNRDTEMRILDSGSGTSTFDFLVDGTNSLHVRLAGVGIRVSAPAAQLHIDQPSSSGAQPVLALDQGDIDDTFINYIGTTAADGSRSISSDTTEDSAKFGAIRCEINGVTKWIRIYDDHS